MSKKLEPVWDPINSERALDIAVGMLTEYQSSHKRDRVRELVEWVFSTLNPLGKTIEFSVIREAERRVQYHGSVRVRQLAAEYIRAADEHEAAQKETNDSGVAHR